MTSSVTLTFNSSSDQDLNFGLKLGVACRDGKVASIEIQNLSRNMTEMDVSVLLGGELMEKNEVTVQLNALINTSKIDFYQAAFEYLNADNQNLAKHLSLTRFGACYSMGLGQNWGKHAISVGAQGTKPFKFDAKWDHKKI